LDTNLWEVPQLVIIKNVKQNMKNFINIAVLHTVYVYHYANVIIIMTLADKIHFLNALTLIYQQTMD